MQGFHLSAAAATAFDSTILDKLRPSHHRRIWIIFALLGNVTVIIRDTRHIIGSDTKAFMRFFQTAYQRMIKQFFHGFEPHHGKRQELLWQSAKPLYVLSWQSSSRR